MDAIRLLSGLLGNGSLSSGLGGKLLGGMLGGGGGGGGLGGMLGGLLGGGGQQAGGGGLGGMIGSVCLLYTSPSPRDRTRSRMPSSA